MSDVNSTLPDDEALAAFANTALGGGRRRRRQQGAGGAEESAGSPAAGPAADDAQPTEEPPAAVDTAPAADTPAPESAAPAATPAAAEPAASAGEPVGEGKATVPAQTAAVESAPAEEVAEDAPADDPPASRATRGEVAVRAVTVPMTQTLIPPGLRDGAVIEVQVPDLGPAGARATQCTVMVSQDVRDRFAHYQLTKKMAGEKEPSNALVVRRAFLHARRNALFVDILRAWYHAANAVDEEDWDEDGLLGGVVGRRTTRGRVRNTGQQSFRPSEQELATYDAFTTAYGFSDRSAFMEGILDRFLPPLPSPGRRR
ncbi:hypothetical protein [Streptomyces sp. NPDC056683]|uniref:hypothetical protein n=1 Tax=Streptomyces sp. NPDC056683 TaxID=3345910 RepID=UPI0036BDC865